MEDDSNNDGDDDEDYKGRTKATTTTSMPLLRISGASDVANIVRKALVLAYIELSGLGTNPSTGTMSKTHEMKPGIDCVTPPHTLYYRQSSR